MKTLFAGLMLLAGLTAFSQQEIKVDNFSEISLNTSATVYLTHGNTQKVEVEGDEDDIENLEIFVRGKDLIIRNKRTSGWFSWGRNDVTIYITTPKVNGLSVSGSGDLISKNKLNSEDLTLSVSGSGHIEIEVDAKTTTVSISGSGKVYLKGNTNQMRASISGSGKIKGEDFVTGSFNASISGSGSCEIHVEESLDARISGSGSVYYKGSPNHVNSRTSGSGKVKKM
ncbi:MAG: head GIN domain-containing protein [Fulvivirga sp.]|nr:head GIN domain-containing protein [Fulvivirga sp.]